MLKSSDVTVATYAAHPHLNSSQHTLRHPRTYIFILHVHTVSAAQSTYRVFTEFHWTGSVPASLCFAAASFFMCVSNWFVFTVTRWRGDEGGWGGSFLSVLAHLSLRASCGSYHTLRSCFLFTWAQCQWNWGFFFLPPIVRENVVTILFYGRWGCLIFNL